MTFKHINFFESEVMRNLEKIAFDKNLIKRSEYQYSATFDESPDFGLSRLNKDDFLKEREAYLKIPESERKSKGWFKDDPRIKSSKLPAVVVMRISPNTLVNERGFAAEIDSASSISQCYSLYQEKKADLKKFFAELKKSDPEYNPPDINDKDGPLRQSLPNLGAGYTDADLRAIQLSRAKSDISRDWWTEEDIDIVCIRLYAIAATKAAKLKVKEWGGNPAQGPYAPIAVADFPPALDRIEDKMSGRNPGEMTFEDDKITPQDKYPEEGSSKLQPDSTQPKKQIPSAQAPAKPKKQTSPQAATPSTEAPAEKPPQASLPSDFPTDDVEEVASAPPKGTKDGLEGAVEEKGGDGNPKKESDESGAGKGDYSKMKANLYSIFKTPVENLTQEQKDYILAVRSGPSRSTYLKILEEYHSGG